MSLRRRLVRHFSCFAAAAFVIALPPSPAHAIEINGYLQESAALLTNSDRDDDLIFHRQTLNLKLQERPTKNIYLRVEADGWHDAADFQDDSSEFRARLREGYVKFRFDKFDFRLGRMQIAWGEADGVIVSDQVSPFDFENFIVPKFDEIRLGVDGAALDYYFDSGTELQLIWIGQFQEPDFPELTSPWSFLTPADLNNLQAGGFSFDDPVHPARTMHNSEFGIRLSGHPSVADWSIGYLRSWDDRPALRLSPGIGGTGRANLVHHQYDLFVAGLVAPIGPVLFTADTAYERGRMLTVDGRLPAAAAFAANGLISEEDVWRTVIALDFKPKVPGWSQPDAAIQFVHEQVVTDGEAIAQARQSDLVSVRLSAAYGNETIKPWILAIGSVHGDDLWIQARVDYEPIDRWRLSLEYDFFEGRAYDRLRGKGGGTFGMFDDNDSVLGTVRYSY